MKALITAGGHGTRLRPITYSMNKHLIPIGNKPMIFHAIEKIAEAGITEIGINVNEGDHTIEESVGDGSAWGVKVTYLEQAGGALGLAHIIKNARDFLGEDSFVFYLGDNIILGSIKPFVEAFLSSGASGYLALSKVPDPQRFGVPELGKNGEILRVVEKPENPPSEFAVTGIYCYDASVHDAVDGIEYSERGELEISDVHTWLIENGHTVKYEIVEGWWKDTGKPGDLLEGNALVLDALEGANQATTVEEGVELKGEVELLEGCQVLGKSVIHGPVSIGRNAVIRDAWIGPHTTIGHSTEIEGARVERSIVMDEADIRTDKHIVDSIIGHNATISLPHSETESGYRMIIGENAQLEL
ncbi:MAG: glucose-1-phosphate thymidylyltransferase [Candidatus Kerfeldbacteria bacterium CG15_BIG_FIL_POST_REV_8_21_14_020_45_12]|uniref:Glucose-1-phosphate thymidylyltransferase n=1 Tax=Candidatus Kerfeldbacteria bacterium CG15_BIG_FIL_POST_REV_8_21_14_020_45_12 TaxID=2014247 RepID=A0A2M7H3C6_9BACT|nr:MAG: glucose-1-phosphate thymidylyltransferase [Candidatus Kerfeldbacteria bacterium CG15_BIG_FIL_POST_REV_8_21_14_020_45_12]PJA93742.1 MAG: glucose-1-phosphate thymidylyltransferase [Candidatus Kerfeldbacteria bacterium CG_4_9_14_3_um_filter_45_8]